MEERAARERELMDEVQAALSTHLPPSVIIGSGHAKLWHKMHSVIHGLWLETGSATLLDAFCRAVVAFTTDQGTESGLSKVPILRVTSVLPWMPKPQAEQSEHDLAPGPDNVAQHENAVIDLTGSVSIAGLLHIAHNSTNDLAKSMEQFDTVVAQMQAVSRLLRKKDSKARLLESCFSDPVGLHLRSDLRSFSAKVHTGRWGTIAECIDQLLLVELALRFGWDIQKFGRGRTEDSVDVQAASDAIGSATFWAYLRMLQHLTSIITAATTWAESCPCHYKLEKLGKSQAGKRLNLKKQWSKCPLRGCRSAELASGGFLDVLRGLSETTAGHLLTALPRDISFAERGVILQEYERGRSHLLFVFSVRLEFWQHAPWCIFQCGHMNPEIQKEGLRKCLSLPATHPLLVELQAPELSAEARAYVEGAEESLASLTLLSRFAAKLLCCPTAERAVEGDHAQAMLIHFCIFPSLLGFVTVIVMCLRRKPLQSPKACHPDPNNP